MSTTREKIVIDCLYILLPWSPLARVSPAISWDWWQGVTARSNHLFFSPLGDCPIANFVIIVMRRNLVNPDTGIRVVVLLYV